MPLDSAHFPLESLLISFSEGRAVWQQSGNEYAVLTDFGRNFGGSCHHQKICGPITVILKNAIFNPFS